MKLKTVPLLLDWRDPDDDPRPGSGIIDAVTEKKAACQSRSDLFPLPQEVRQIATGKRRRRVQDITVGPANPTLWRAMFNNIIEAVDEEGKELDPSIRMEIANRFILLRNENNQTN